MRGRRIAIITSVVFAVLLAVLALLVQFWAPREIERRVVRKAHERLGLVVSIERVRLSPDGVILDGVRFSDRGVIEGTLAHVTVALRWRALLSSTIEVSRLSIARGSIDIHLDERGLSRWIAHVRGNATTASGTSAAPIRSYPPLDLDRVELRVHDANGLLATTVLRSMGGGRGAMSFGSSLLIAGERPNDALEVRDLEVTVRRSDHLRVESISASSVDVHWSSSLTDEHAADANRLVPRARAALATVRRALRTSADDAGDEDEDASWSRRLASGFIARLDSVTITGPAVAGADDRFSLSSVRATYDGRGRARVSGSGRGVRIGQASWDLTFEPDRGKVEGRLALAEVPLSIVSPLIASVPWYPSEGGRVSMDAELRAESLDVVVFRGSLEIRDAALSHPRIASSPVRGLGLRIESEATIRPLQRRVNLRSARITLGAASVQWTGDVEIDPEHYVARGALVLPQTSCDDAVHAIPADVLGPLVGFGLAGTIAARMDLDIDSRALTNTRLEMGVTDGCTFVSAPPEADVSRFAGPFLHQALEPDGTVFEMETGPGTSRWVPLFAMSPYVIEAVVGHEDAAYYTHRGFAPWAIRDAVVRNLTEGRYVVGASTITMQLAKNLFLRREKTLVRKIQEVILAWWLERALDKERILELYLNVIEYGPSVYGIGAASRWWFGHGAAALTPVEASILAIILPAPKMYAGMRGMGELSPAMRGRVGRFLRHMAAERRLDAESLRYALEELEGYRFGAERLPAYPEGDENSGGGFGGEYYVPNADWSAAP